MMDLDLKSIRELKGFGKPPKEVAVVCASVGLLIGFGKDCTWKDSQKMMSNPLAFCDTLKAFDAKRIPDATLKRCEALISQPCFNCEVMSTKSKAAADLCLWVLKVVAFRKAWGEAKRTMESKRQEKQSQTTNSDAVVTDSSSNITPEERMKTRGVASCLCKGDICELKSLANPPELVKRTLEAVAIIFDKEASWKGAKAMMGDPEFLSNIIAFEATCVKEAAMEKLEPIVHAPDFLPPHVKRVSAAAVGLCEWVHQIYNECSRSNADTASTASPLSTQSTYSTCNGESLESSELSEGAVMLTFEGEADM
jgi:hypothetical protein